MSVLFNRQVKVTLGGSESIEKLKISFVIEKSISSNPNVLQSINIWNLSKSTRSKLGQEWKEISIEAGYEGFGGGGQIGLIFSGTIRDVAHPRDGPDIITQISAGEGDQVHRAGVIAKLVEQGGSLKSLVQELQGAMQGVSAGQMLGLDAGSGQSDFQRPVMLYGSIVKEMNRLSRAFDFYWSIQNDSFETIASDGHIQGSAVITETTGMVGKPAKTDSGVKVSALLNPNLLPGRSFELISEDVSGMFRIDSVKFEGDNGEGDQAGPFLAHVDASEIGGGSGGSASP